MVMYSRNGSSELRLVELRSKPAPTPAGAQRFFLMPMAALPADPCTISMHTRRIFLFAAAARRTLRAGTIASRNGSARVAPMPFRTVRRGSCLFVMYIASVSFACVLTRGAVGCLRLHLRLRHPERGAVDDAEDER